jgi:transposase
MLLFCGIDVSKDGLDVMVLPDEYSSSVPNDPAGWAILVEQLRGFSITAIGIEASGGYERGAVRSLQAAGMPCAKSILSSCGSSPRQAGFWPRTIRSTPE